LSGFNAASAGAGAAVPSIVIASRIYVEGHGWYIWAVINVRLMYRKI